MNFQAFKQRLHEVERKLTLDFTRLTLEARAAGRVDVPNYTDGALSLQGTSQALLDEVVAARTLIQVRDALQRIDAGTYGKCMGCGCEIPAALLLAEPWAHYCLEDQQKVDQAAVAAELLLP